MLCLTVLYENTNSVHAHISINQKAIPSLVLKATIVQSEELARFAMMRNIIRLNTVYMHIKVFFSF